MTRRPTHRYVRDHDLASDWLGRVPCRMCGIPEKPAEPKNRVHTEHVEPEDNSDRIIGEGTAA